MQWGTLLPSDLIADTLITVLSLSIILSHIDFATPTGVSEERSTSTFFKVIMGDGGVQRDVHDFMRFYPFLNFKALGVLRDIVDSYQFIRQL